jgi:cytochrome c biogenesis protein CcmG, thiol:disulfide interchange protein DsbE
MTRQWYVFAAVVGLIAALIGMGWLVRDRLTMVEVGTAAPDYVATDLQGNPVRLADYRGEVVLLNIWATWCPPCREEMPSMQRLHEELGPRGLHVIAVSVDAPVGRLDRSGNPGGDVAGFVQELGLTFPVWLDPQGGIQRTFTSPRVPESFVIDRHGMIVKKVIGSTEWDSEAHRDLFLRLLGS